MVSEKTSKDLEIKSSAQKWSGSLHPLHIKSLILQAFIKRIPRVILEPFVFEKSLNNNKLKKQHPSKKCNETLNIKKCDANRYYSSFLWLQNNTFTMQIAQKQHIL